MTTPKPPFDDALDRLLIVTHDKVTSTLHDCARAELSELRAYKAAYDEAMAKIASVVAKWDSTADEEMFWELQDYVKAERAAGRFKP